MRPTAKRDKTALSGALSGLAFVVAIGGAGRLAKQPFPQPGSTPDEIRSYYRNSKSAARFNLAWQAVAIVAQAQFTESVARLASQHSRHPRALRMGALVSGGAAAGCLAASTITHSTLTMPPEKDDAEILATTRRVFVAGGPVHGVAYGVFTAVLTEAARDTGVLGRTAAAMGWASGAASLSSPAYFRWERAGWLIPIGRFSGYLVSGIIGARLGRTAARPEQIVHGPR